MRNLCTSVQVLFSYVWVQGGVHPISIVEPRTAANPPPDESCELSTSCRTQSPPPGPGAQTTTPPKDQTASSVVSLCGPQCAMSDRYGGVAHCALRNASSPARFMSTSPPALHQRSRGTNERSELSLKLLLTIADDADVFLQSMTQITSKIMALRISLFPPPRPTWFYASGQRPQHSQAFGDGRKSRLLRGSSGAGLASQDVQKPAFDLVSMSLTTKL